MTSTGIYLTVPTNDLPDPAFYCRRCESFCATEACPLCGIKGVRMPRNTANAVLWGENLERMAAYCKRGRLLPEVE